jgi:uncharacterized protein (DUF58 family)
VIQLVLDTDPRSHVGEGSDNSREWAIRSVASLAKGWLEAGGQVGAVWNGEVFPPASGRQQVQRLLDSLAQLSEAPGPALSDALCAPVCRDFQDGLQVIVTTDVALTNLPQPSAPEVQRRWVVLRTAAFAGGAAISPSPLLEVEDGRAGLPLRPWLDIDSAERIPALLRGGWKEAQHGT